MNKVSRRSLLWDSAKMVGGLVMVTTVGKVWAQSAESEPHVGHKTEEEKLSPKGRHNAGYYDNGTSANGREARRGRKKTKTPTPSGPDGAHDGDSAKH